MLDQLKKLFSSADEAVAPADALSDKKLAAAALMVQVIAADGVVTEQEEDKLHAVLRQHYAVSDEEQEALARAARAAQEEAIDLYGFTSVLKREMEHGERLALIEDLWEMVYADGKLHEFEDNVVWRVAELVGIQTHERMALKQRVLDRQN